jgi:hypothetical protein
MVGDRIGLSIQREYYYKGFESPHCPKIWLLSQWQSISVSIITVEGSSPSGASN